MTVYDKNGSVYAEGVSCFDLALTLDCGQAFRWERQEDGSFCGVAGGRFLHIIQRGDTLIFENTALDDFNAFWRHYFALDRDYAAVCEKLQEDSLLAETVREYYGIHVLQQEAWEALCSFVISQQNNIKRIRLIIRRLCEACGSKLPNGSYAFPTPKQLSALSEEELRALGAGYRAKYLVRLAQAVTDGEIDLDKVKTLSLDEARKALLTLYGVGVKVADCTLLFGLGFDSAFPLDVWMKRVMAYYPNGLPACFDGIEGIAQQYLFHWARNHL